MAKVVEQGDDLVLTLSFWEKLGGFHGSIRAPKSAMTRKVEVENPWRHKALLGVRAPGTGIPYVILLGTLRKAGFKNFAAIYGRGPATIYEFKDQKFANWIVTTQ
jgi:hypothetical protein